MKLPLATLGRAWYIASAMFGIGSKIYRDFELDFLFSYVCLKTLLVDVVLNDTNLQSI